MRKERHSEAAVDAGDGPESPAGPYHFIDREFLVITYETDPALIRKQCRSGRKLVKWSL
jgi:acetoacetate decarboxylase